MHAYQLSIAVLVFSSLIPRNLEARFHTALTSLDETVCFTAEGNPNFSDKPRIPYADFQRIRQQEQELRLELSWLGLSDYEILQTLEAMCPEPTVHPWQAADAYLSKLGFASLTVYEIKSEQRAYQEYKSQCERRGFEAQSPENYLYERDAILAGSGHPLADYREGWDGWNHSHGCDGSESANCMPHHHFLTTQGRAKAIEILVHRDVMAYRNENAGLSSKTTSKEANAGASGSGGFFGGNIGGSVSSSQTSDVVTYEHLQEKRQEFQTKWNSASDNEILTALKKEDGNLVSGSTDAPEPTSPSEPEPDTLPDPFEAASDLDLESNSTPAGNHLLAVSCGEQIDYDQHAKTEDPHQIEEDRRRAEQEAKCLENYGMGCDEFEAWIKFQSEVKISSEMEIVLEQQIKADQECLKLYGMSCDDYDAFLKQNIKLVIEQPWYLDTGKCEMNDFYLECGSETGDETKPAKLFNP